MIHTMFMAIFLVSDHDASDIKCRISELWLAENKTNGGYSVDMHMFDTSQLVEAEHWAFCSPQLVVFN